MERTLERFGDPAIRDATDRLGIFFRAMCDNLPAGAVPADHESVEAFRWPEWPKRKAKHRVTLGIMLN